MIGKLNFPVCLDTFVVLQTFHFWLAAHNFKSHLIKTVFKLSPLRVLTAIYFLLFQKLFTWSLAAMKKRILTCSVKIYSDGVNSNTN